MNRKPYTRGDLTSARKAVGAHETVTFILELGKDLGVALFTSWLYDKLKGRAKALRVDRTEIEIDDGTIRRVIEESFQLRD